MHRRAIIGSVPRTASCSLFVLNQGQPAKPAPSRASSQVIAAAQMWVRPIGPRLPHHGLTRPDFTLDRASANVQLAELWGAGLQRDHGSRSASAASPSSVSWAMRLCTIAVGAEDGAQFER